MVNSNLAAKALIIDKNKLLIIKRAPDEVHESNIWELPGGRLDPGENPFEGLKREIMEEMGIGVDIIHPINVHHFTHSDGNIVTLIIFFAKPITTKITLSIEHSEYDWVLLDKCKEKLHKIFHGDVDMYNKIYQCNQ